MPWRRSIVHSIDKGLDTGEDITGVADSLLLSDMFILQISGKKDNYNLLYI